MGRSYKVHFSDREQLAGAQSHADCFLSYAAHIVADVEVVATLQTGPATAARATLEKVRAFLRSLLPRFDSKHVSLVLVLDGVLVDGSLLAPLVDLLETDRPDLIFKSLSLEQQLVNRFTTGHVQILRDKISIKSLISRCNALKLKSVHIDNSNTLISEDKVQNLEHLELVQSFYFPSESDEPLRLKSFKATDYSNWPSDFQKLTRLDTLESIEECNNPRHRYFLVKLLDQFKHQLKSLKQLNQPLRW